MAGPASVFCLLSGSAMAAGVLLCVVGLTAWNCFIRRSNSFQPEQPGVIIMACICEAEKFPKHLL